MLFLSCLLWGFLFYLFFFLGGLFFSVSKMRILAFSVTDYAPEDILQYGVNWLSGGLTTSKM